MGFQKYAKIDSILEVKSSPQRLAFAYGEGAGAQFGKFAALHEGHREEDGYLYVRCRAISSRVNKNNDGWPAEELSKAYSTFIGRPIFVDHNNDDITRTRGVVVDSQLHVEDEKTSGLDSYYSTAPDNHKPETWIELLMEIDKETYPKLAEAIEKGDLDAVSMGANIDLSVCSVCANEAVSPAEYCSHIKQKGMTFEITSADGEKIKKKAYEDCYGINFFEISNVFDPADDTADSWLDKTASLEEKAAEAGVDFDEVKYYLAQKGERIYSNMPSLADLAAAGVGVPVDKIASYKQAADPEQFVAPANGGGDARQKGYIPQSEQVRAPQDVDTLRNERLCEICKAADMQVDPDGISRCPTCGHVEEPAPTDNPDLSQARDMDLRQDANPDLNMDGDPTTPAADPLDNVTFSPVQPVAPVAARNLSTSSGRISEMFTSKLKTASKEEADKVLPARVSSIQRKLGKAGITRSLYAAAHAADLRVRVEYPAVKRAGNVLDVPGKNGIFNLFFAEESARELNVPTDEVPIVIHAADSEELAKFLQLFDAREAAKDKEPILPSNAKPSDEPKSEKIVSDQLAPVEASADPKLVREGAELLVELDGKRYKLTPEDSADEEEEKGKPDEEEEGKSDEEKEAARRHIVRTETDPDGNQRVEEIVEEDGQPEAAAEEAAPALAAVASEDREDRLMLAFKLADLAVEMGLTSQDDKMAYIAELEEESIDQLKTREATMQSVKDAGLAKRTGARSGIRRVPRLAHAVPSLNGSGSVDNTPDEALYL